MSFALYFGGIVILIAGLIYGAVILDVPPHWIAAGAIVMLGLSVVTGVTVTRQKDPAG